MVLCSMQLEIYLWHDCQLKKSLYMNTDSLPKTRSQPFHWHSTCYVTTSTILSSQQWAGNWWNGHKARSHFLLQFSFQSVLWKLFRWSHKAWNQSMISVQCWIIRLPRHTRNPSVAGINNGSFAVAWLILGRKHLTSCTSQMCWANNILNTVNSVALL